LAATDREACDGAPMSPIVKRCARPWHTEGAADRERRARWHRTRRPMRNRRTDDRRERPGVARSREFSTEIGGIGVHGGLRTAFRWMQPPRATAR